MKRIIWIGLILGLALGGEIKEANPGLGVAFNSTFVRKIVDTIAPIIIKEVKGLNINAAGSLNLSSFLFNYTLDHFRVNDINLNYSNTGIDMSKGKINYTLSNFSLYLDAQLGFTTDPVLFYGRGNGLFRLWKLSNVLVINFELGQNQLPLIHLDYSYAHIEDNTINARFYGTNDVFTVLNLIQSFAIPIIVNFTKGEMTKENKQTIESTINGLLEGLPHKVQLPNTHIELDYGFLLAPSASENYLPLSLNGTAICANETACKPYKGNWPTPPKKLDVFGGNGSLQLILSDYLLNTLIISAYQDNLLHFLVTPEIVRSLTNGSFSLDTDFIGVFIPIIRQTYGPGRDVFLDIDAIQPPKLSISTKEMTLEMVTQTNFFLNNSQTHKMEKILGVKTTFRFGLLAHMANNYLKGNITKFAFELELNYKSLKDISIDDVQRMFDLLYKLAIPQVNSLLKDGIPLPTLGSFFSLKSSELKLLDQYIRFDFNPEPIKEAFEELIPKFIHKKFGSLQVFSPSQLPEPEQVETPISLPKWLQLIF